MQVRSHAAAIRPALRLRLSLISAVRLSSPLRTTPRQSLLIEARTWSESSDGLTVTHGCFSPPCISCSVLASGEGGVTRWPGYQYCASQYFQHATPPQPGDRRKCCQSKCGLVECRLTVLVLQTPYLARNSQLPRSFTPSGLLARRRPCSRQELELGPCDSVNCRRVSSCGFDERSEPVFG